MNDQISRQQAVDALWRLNRKMQMMDNTQAADKIMYGIYLSRRVIENLPSEKTEQRTGKWNNYKDEHSCSVCQSVVIRENWDDDNRYDYCPYCGARMVEE